MKFTKKRINNKTTRLKNSFKGNDARNYSDLIFFKAMKETRGGFCNLFKYIKPDFS
jgi:hypothetical protein